MKVVDSDALGRVTQALGLTGKGAAVTELEDSTVAQTFDVAPVIRRGRTFAATEGLFAANLSNVHPGAGSLTTLVNPFDVTTGRIEPYPNPIPRGFDLWLLHAGLARQTGTGTVTAGLYLIPGADALGWGLNNAGAAVVANPPFLLAYWDSLVTEYYDVGVASAAAVAIQRAIRLRPGTQLRFASTASALATYRADLLLGLFPVGLGQDLFT